MIDDIEQNRFLRKRLFYMPFQADPRVNLWVNVGNCVVVSATHNGYTALDDNILHKRSIWTSMANHTFLIVDEFSGELKRSHRFDLRFITPLDRIEQRDDRTVVIHSGRAGSLTIGPLKDAEGTLYLENASHFPRYGVRRAANVIRYSYDGNMPFKISTLICYNRDISYSAAMFRTAALNLERKFQDVGVS
jgi:hypothetical protein